MKETELARKVIAWLEEKGWDVYQEVQIRELGPIADIVAIKDGKVWAIECKTAYGSGVLGQADRWYTDFKSVAVPFRGRGYAKGRKDVGIIAVYGNGEVSIAVDAPEMEWHHESKVFINTVTDRHKTFCVAGSPGGGHLTAYKLTMEKVENFVSENPGCTARQIVDELGKMHYASEAGARGSLSTSMQTHEFEFYEVDTSVRPARYYLK